MFVKQPSWPSGSRGAAPSHSGVFKESSDAVAGLRTTRVGVRASSSEVKETSEAVAALRATRAGVRVMRNGPPPQGRRAETVVQALSLIHI